MKNFITLVFVLFGLFGFSQKSEKPFLFCDCDNKKEIFSDKIIIPQSSDFVGISIFEDVINKTLSFDQYEAYVVQYNDSNFFITDIIIEIGNGDDVIFIPFCLINEVIKNNTFKIEFETCFNNLKQSVN